MKKYILIIVFLFTCSFSTAYAQGTQELIVVPYTTDKHLTSIYQKVEKVFDIIKPPEVVEPIVLAGATSKQVSELKKQGFRVDTLDHNATLEDYIYLYTTNTALIPQLSSFGEVRRVSTNRIVVKLTQGREFTSTGTYSAFSQLPSFTANHFPEPVYSTNLIPEKTVSWIQRFKQTILYPILLVGIVVLSLSIFFTLRNRGIRLQGWKNLIAQIVLFIMMVVILVIIAL